MEDGELSVMHHEDYFLKDCNTLHIKAYDRMVYQIWTKGQNLELPVPFEGDCRKMFVLSTHKGYSVYLSERQFKDLLFTCLDTKTGLVDFIDKKLKVTNNGKELRNKRYYFELVQSESTIE